MPLDLDQGPRLADPPARMIGLTHTKPSPTVLLCIGLPSGMAALSALAGLGGAAFGADQVALALLGFEFVCLAAGVLGVLAALGLFGASIEVAGLCVAGAIIVGSGFGSLSVQHTLGGVGLLPFLAGRAALGGVILFGCVLLSLGGSVKGWTRLLIGVALAGPVLIVVGLAGLGRMQGLASAVKPWPPAALWALGMFAFVLGAVVFSIGAHLIINAFDPSLRRESGAGPEPKPSGASAE